MGTMPIVMPMQSGCHAAVLPHLRPGVGAGQVPGLLILCWSNRIPNSWFLHSYSFEQTGPKRGRSRSPASGQDYAHSTVGQTNTACTFRAKSMQLHILYTRHNVSSAYSCCKHQPVCGRVDAPDDGQGKHCRICEAPHFVVDRPVCVFVVTGTEELAFITLWRFRGVPVLAHLR